MKKQKIIIFTLIFVFISLIALHANELKVKSEEFYDENSFLNEKICFNFSTENLLGKKLLKVNKDNITYYAARRPRGRGNGLIIAGAVLMGVFIIKFVPAGGVLLGIGLIEYNETGEYRDENFATTLIGIGGVILGIGGAIFITGMILLIAGVVKKVSRRKVSLFIDSPEIKQTRMGFSIKI